MKSLCVCFVLLMLEARAQNISKLFEDFPPMFENCDAAFHVAMLEWSEERLDNDSIFKRATSWAPGGIVKSYADRLDRLQAFIERSSENNSFSLNAPPDIAKETNQSLEALHQLQTQISQAWVKHRASIVEVNAEFLVPNELENSCEQITQSMESLSKVSVELNKAYQGFYITSKEHLTQFQQSYDELTKIKHPMVNNQCLDELSSLAAILAELSNVMNFHFKNMVETKMAQNNAMCR